MGFFSDNCKHCTHPILCAHATQDKNGWMNEGVAITSRGSVLIGSYDGYGNLDGAEAIGFADNTVYHEACWEVLGKPMGYAGPSDNAADQGWFFDDDAHNWASPEEAKAHPNEGYHHILNPKEPK